MESNFLVLVAGGVIVATAPLFIALYFRYRNRRTILDTIRIMAEKEQSIAPELVTALVVDTRPAHADLRRGLFFLSLAAATVCFDFALDQPEVFRPLMGISAFPALLGATFLFLHIFTKKKAS